MHKKYIIWKYNTFKYNSNIWSCINNIHYYCIVNEHKLTLISINLN